MDRVYSSNSKRRNLSIIFLCVFVLTGVATALLSEGWTIAHLDSMPIVCPLRRLTGLLCSFCGMTHAWMYFWHGDFAKAYAENKLSLPLYFGAPVIALSAGFSNFWTSERTRKSLLAVALVLIAYTILRNL